MGIVNITDTANRRNQALFANSRNTGYLSNPYVFQSSFDTSSWRDPNMFALSNYPSRFTLSDAPSWYTPQLSKPVTQMPVDRSDGVQRSQALGNSQASVNNFGNAATASNIFSKIGGGSSGGSSGAGWAAATQTAASALLSTPAGDKALDVADPVWHLASGRESTVGNSLSTAGKETFKSGVASGSPYTMLAGAGLKVLGGLTNAAWGIKTDKTAENNANNAIDYYSGYRSNASSFDDITAPLYMGSFNAPYKGGWFSGGKANRKNNDLKDKFLASESYANRSYENNINNISNTQMGNLLRNYNADVNVGAFGGPLGSQGAIDYGFMSDYLMTRNKAASAKDKIPLNSFGSLPVTPLSTFALGGDIQTNGSDFTTGLAKIDAGGTHEQNPYQGVQVGISKENGNPNLVEEGETIFDDYVFSRRIKVDNKTKKRFHLGKKAKMSYADLSKKLEKESLERPNDPISQNGLRKQLSELADEQERQKAEKQEKEARELFNSLPVEQQRDIMQQVAMEEQQAQQEQMQQGQQPSMEGMPGQQEPQQMVDEQMQQQQPQMQQMPEDVQMSACGGKLNRFDDGGDMKSRIYRYLKMATDRDFDKWAQENKVDKITDWDNILKNEKFLNALRSSNPDLYDAIQRGYDFGNYKAPTGKYDWGNFIKKLDAYTKSKTLGNTDGHYAVDRDFDIGKFKSIKDYEDSANYRAYTDYMKDVINRVKGISFKYGDDDHSYDKIIWKDPSKVISREDFDALNVLNHTIQGTSTAKDGKTVPMWSDKDNDGYSSLVRNADELFNSYRTDGDGGIFHLNPEPLDLTSENENYEIDDKNNVYRIYNAVPNGWNKVNSYSWNDPNGSKTVNYYRRPIDTKTEAETAEKDGKIKPVHKPTWGRILGLMGPEMGLALQSTGYGKPNYSNIDRAVSILSAPPALAHHTPYGTKMRYDPMDIQYELNKLEARSRATDRAILNNSSPIGTKMAGALANGYNTQLQAGELYKKALEYDNAQRMQTLGFNNAIDKDNAAGLNSLSVTNAGIMNAYNQAKAQLAMSAAKEKLDTDASWYRGIYGNINNLFKGIGDWGKENEQHNMIADMAADGIFGTIGRNQAIAKGYVNAQGGKLRRRRRGLTF